MAKSNNPRIIQFKNRNLHGKLFRLVKRGIKELSTELDSNIETIRRYNKIKTIEEPYRQYTRYPLLKENLLINSTLDYFIDSRKELLTSLLEYISCISLIDTDEILYKQVNKIHELHGVIQYVSHWTYFSHILKKMTRTYIRHKKVSRQIYDKLYSDLEQFLYNERINLVEICPLINFEITDYNSSIILSDSLSIRRISEEEKELLAERLVFYEIDLYDIHKINYVIEYKFCLSKGFDIAPEIQDREYPADIKSTLAAVITGLRLYKDGQVGTNMFLQMVTLDIPIRIGHVIFGLDLLGLTTSFGIPYILNKTEVAEFVGFWNRYGSLLSRLLDFKREEDDQYKNIKTALNRYNSSFGKRNTEDTLVDWMISFEALFSKKDDPKEGMTHRLALRSSRFSKVASEREEFYIKLKKAYGVRSKIVHGDQWEPLKIDFRYHISQSIARYLDQMLSGRKHDSILNSIDFC